MKRRYDHINLRVPDLGRVSAFYKTLLPPNGSTGMAHHVDAKVRGGYKMSFTNFTAGNSHSFGGTYLELVPNERICHTDNSTTRICPAKCR
jgi:uncharacterized protein YndB with AHSA1/START domain